MRLDSALVAVPFTPLQTPSLGLGLLHASLARRSIKVKTFNFSFPFAKRIGPLLYDQISDGEPARADLVGEWVFNGNLFDAADLDIEGYVRDVLRGGSRHHRIKRFRSEFDLERWVERILWVREQTAPFLAECVDTLVRVQPRVVGLTSMFEEHVAALSLAKRLKSALPDTFVVLGGANCEGPMGLETVRQCPFVDAVVSGEADFVFPDLVEHVLRGDRPAGLQGVYLRGGADADGKSSTCPPVERMDELPYPDFDDYFEQLKAADLAFDEIPPPHLLFETARGCWWGQVNHCTFCGLNGATIAFRSKSASRALTELLYLTARYPDYPVAVSDNILDYRYLKEFVPALAEHNPGVKLFYEVKANLKKEEVLALRDAGITRIQPGVESFSSPILKLMKKGVSAIQNIQLLKWCKELDVTPVWGLLWGFPGEDPAEYARMARLIPLLTHLEPPIGVTQIRLDRFSPNFAKADEMGFAKVKPFPSYRYVYPLADEALRNMAYFFTYEYADGRRPARYAQPMVDAVNEWLRVHERSALFFVDKGRALVICDLRPVAREPIYVLSDLMREAYLACDRARSLRQVCDLLTARGAAATPERVEEGLGRLRRWGLVVEDNGLFLGLAPALREDLLSEHVLENFERTVGTLGREQDGELIIPLSAVTTDAGGATRLPAG